jgi:hypothetical protein
MCIKAEVCLQVRQVVVGLHLLAHHVAELIQLVAGATLQYSCIMAVGGRFLECNSGLDIVLVFSVRVENVTFLLGVTVCATTVSEDSLDARGAIVKRLAGLTCLVTFNRFAATIETFLEISHIHHTWYRDIESSKTICAHKQILR